MTISNLSPLIMLIVPLLFCLDLRSVNRCWPVCKGRIKSFMAKLIIKTGHSIETRYSIEYRSEFWVVAKKNTARTFAGLWIIIYLCIAYHSLAINV
mgnify:CR=1 FL=1